MAIEQDWWRNKLAEDIYATLRLKEQTLPAFKSQSPQLWLRRHLVDWLSLIVGDLGICATAQHLAVYLLDYFMEGLEVEMCYLHLIALTCLVLAAKFEEHCDRVPVYSKLNKYLHVNQYNGGQPYTSKQYLNMELNVLKFCRFELCIPTVAHFLPYFLKVAVDEDDLRDGIPITSKATVETYLEKHAFYFQEIVLQDVMFREFAPSLVAASCVAAARICLHLTPTWPKQMELMTDYYLEQLLPCVHNMLGTHQQDSLAKSGQGYPQSVSTCQSYLPSYGPVWNYFPSNPQMSSNSSVSSSTLNNGYSPCSSVQGYKNGLSTDTYSGYNYIQKCAEVSSHPRATTKYGPVYQTVTYPAIVNYPSIVPQLCQRVRGS